MATRVVRNENVGDQAAPEVYEFNITGRAGTLVNTVPVTGVSGDRAFWIQGEPIREKAGSRP